MTPKKARDTRKIKVGIVGCGNISPIYFKNITSVFEVLDVVACCDIIGDRAKAKTDEFKGVVACVNEELYSHPDVDIILNITPPKTHAEVSLAAIKAGKTVHSEKPLATNREDAKKILKAAAAKGVRVGCAPDTFLGGGLQTCRKLIDDGWIGEPIGATAFMMGRGPESWHPEPFIFYQVGAGPMLDVGVYYVTALVSLLGPVKRVTSSARITFPERLITSQPHFGTKIKVEMPTFVAGVMDFASGAVASIVTSFDVWKSTLPRIEIYGTEGALLVPDPNTFGGPVKVMRPGGEWSDIPLTHGYAENSRGLGLADLAYGLRSGRPHRASGQMAYHVLDVMLGFNDASAKGEHVNIQSDCERPAALPMGLRKGVLDE
jgi:predicted dehydrogenase